MKSKPRGREEDFDNRCGNYREVKRETSSEIEENENLSKLEGITTVIFVKTSDN